MSAGGIVAGCTYAVAGQQTAAAVQATVYNARTINGNVNLSGTGSLTYYGSNNIYVALPGGCSTAISGSAKAVTCS